MIKCKKCLDLKEEKYFYKNKDNTYKKTCKWCLGVKNPDKKNKKRIIKYTIDTKKPSKKELVSFINEMNYKCGYFDFLDCLRLVDIFTRKNGIISTKLSMEDELMYMWLELKKSSLSI